MTLKKCFNVLVLLLFVVSFSGDLAAENLRSIKREYPVVEEQKLLLDPKLCKYMVSYQQLEDVEYVPGVDVNGKPVVSADIDDQPQVDVEQGFSFNVTIDVAEYLQVDLPEGAEANLDVGKVTFENGQVYFNDTLLGSGQEQVLKDLCLEDKSGQ